MTPPAERFERFVDRTAGCWLWTGMTGGTKGEYGYFRATTRATDPKVLAHRFAYELWVGPIPAGLEIDHLCKRRLCVRPDHLEAVTPAVNQQRNRLVVCRAGLHDLTMPENRHPAVRGCYACKKAGMRRRYAEKAGQ
jgi:hypothetical protein